MAACLRLPSLLLLVALAACAAPPGPFEPPPLQPTWEHFAGSLLTGPQPGDAPPELDTDPAHALALQVRLAVVEDLPPGALPRLATRSRMVVGDTPGRPLRSVARLGSGAQLGEGEAAQALLAQLDTGELPVASATGASPTALLPGTTAVLTLPFEPPAFGPLTDVRLMIWRGDTLTLAVLLRGALPPDDEEQGTAPVAMRELVVLQPALPEDGSPLLLALPLQAPGHARAVLLAAVCARPAPAGDVVFAQQVAQAAQSALDATRERRVAASELTATETFLRQVVSAFGVLRDEASRRAALAFLAGASDAPLCADLVLLADAEMLAQLAQLIEEGGGDLGAVVAQGGGLGWLLERSALQLLAHRGEDQPLPPELLGILLRHVGEPGRFPTSLLDIVATCSSTATLRERIVQENLQYLEDSTAAARLRAFDWLDARGLAPAGFDPLAPLAARRAALAAAAAQAEAAAPPADAR
ncbi:MAG TPA: hypothetical protein VFY71_06335 [Planctomycetota bacterium]|nr:hypothetical protein [Planctomycetota bacterium]